MPHPLKTLSTTIVLAAALSLGATASATARPADARPSPTTGGIVLSHTSAYDASTRSCDMAWTFQDNTGKAVRGYMVNLSRTPIKTGKKLPGGVILIAGPNGYPDNDVPAGASSYFYVQAVFMDNKTSKIYSASATC
jgi:hypothetical protein